MRLSRGRSGRRVGSGVLVVLGLGGLLAGCGVPHERIEVGGAGTPNGAASVPSVAPDQLTPLAGSVLARPSTVTGADGLEHVAYGFMLTNPLSLLVTLEKVEILDPSKGAVLATIEGDAILSVLTLFGTEPGATFRGGQAGVLILDATAKRPRDVPRSLVHRVTVSLETAPGVPFEDPDGVLATTFKIGPVQVGDEQPVVIAPPLRGEGWWDAVGCCVRSAHRGAILAVNGGFHAPERYAIDAVQLDDEGRYFVGPVDQLSSYPFFGAPIHAVADGKVVNLLDGLPEQVPGSPAVGVTGATAGGNFIVQDIGGGRFAFYAHLQAGSLQVQGGRHHPPGPGPRPAGQHRQLRRTAPALPRDGRPGAVGLQRSALRVHTIQGPGRGDQLRGGHRRGRGGDRRHHAERALPQGPAPRPAGPRLPVVAFGPWTPTRTSAATRRAGPTSSTSPTPSASPCDASTIGKLSPRVGHAMSRRRSRRRTGMTSARHRRRPRPRARLPETRSCSSARRRACSSLRSQGGRDQFELAGPSFPGEEVYATCIDTRGAEPRLFVGSVSNHWGPVLRRSDDLGATWTEDQTRRARLPGRQRRLAGPHLAARRRARPTSPTSLYAGVEPAALFRSDDGGSTFTLVAGAVGPPPPAASGNRAAVGCASTPCSLHPTDPDRLLDRHLGRRRLPQRRRRAHVAGEQRRHRRRLPARAPMPEFGQCVHKVARDAGDPERLYLQHHGGIYRSDDGGGSWSP